MKENIIDLIIELTDYDLRQNPNIDLIEEDILDSLAFIELVSSLEEMYDIEIQPTQVPDNTWRSVNNIVKMVEKLLNERK